MGEKKLSELLAAFVDKARFRRKSDGVEWFLMKVIGDGSSSARVTFVGTTGPECEYPIKSFLKEFERLT